MFKKTLMALSISSVIGLTGCAGLIGGGSENDTKAAFEELLKNPPTFAVQHFGDPGLDKISLALSHYAEWQGKVLIDYEKQSASPGGLVNDAIDGLNKKVEDLANEKGKEKELEAAKLALKNYEDNMTAADRKAYQEFQIYEKALVAEQLVKWAAVVPALDGLKDVVKDPKGTATRAGAAGAMDFIGFMKKLNTVKDQAQYAYDAKAWYDQISAQMENAKKSSGQK